VPPLEPPPHPAKVIKPPENGTAIEYFRNVLLFIMMNPVKKLNDADGNFWT